jgi:hypothetical protein
MGNDRVADIRLDIRKLYGTPDGQEMVTAPVRNPGTHRRNEMWLPWDEIDVAVKHRAASGAGAGTLPG